MRRLTAGSLLTAVREVCNCDPDLAAVVRRYGPPPLWARSPGFATLVRIILEQQVSLASAKATYGRLQKAVRRVGPGAVARLTPAELRGLGFTRQKAGYCRDLALLLVSGELKPADISRGDDATVRETLMAIRGIGPWSADVYLLMALRHPDIWPPGDIAIAKAVQRVKRLRRLPGAGQLDRLASSWAPWRSVAARILWHYYLCERRHRVRS